MPVFTNSPPCGSVKVRVRIRVRLRVIVSVRVRIPRRIDRLRSGVWVHTSRGG